MKRKWFNVLVALLQIVWLIVVIVPVFTSSVSSHPIQSRGLHPWPAELGPRQPRVTPLLVHEASDGEISAVNWLGGQEFRLLGYFVRHSGGALSRDQLLRDVWGYGVDALTRTLDVHVANLRQKLEIDRKTPNLIRTVRSVGYRFETVSSDLENHAIRCLVQVHTGADATPHRTSRERGSLLRPTMYMDWEFSNGINAVPGPSLTRS